MERLRKVGRVCGEVAVLFSSYFTVGRPPLRRYTMTFGALMRYKRLRQSSFELPVGPLTSDEGLEVHQIVDVQFLQHVGHLMSVRRSIQICASILFAISSSRRLKRSNSVWIRYPCVHIRMRARMPR